MRLEPAVFTPMIRAFYLMFLAILWMMNDSHVAGLMYFLLLACLACLRWRFALPAWTSFIDLILCFVFLPFWSGSAFGAALPLFDSLVKGRARFALFVPLIFAGKVMSPALLLWHLFQAGFLGFVLHYWDRQREAYLLEADRERKARYELERLKSELLAANSKAMQLAEVTERHRIARELHDHLGHDLTGALLGLQAYNQLMDEGEDNKQKQALMEQVVQRLERSTKTLRDTVHDITPVTRLGSDQLAFIAEHFFSDKIDVDFRKSGNMLSVAAHHWEMLEACLKEALTNIAKHSQADKVEIRLDVTDTLVRLSVKDNGHGSKDREKKASSNRGYKVKFTDSLFSGQSSHNNGAGTGIRHLKIRARAVGGSVSIDNNVAGFLLVCVLPLEGGMAE